MKSIQRKFLSFYGILIMVALVMASCVETRQAPDIDALITKIVSIDEPKSSNGFISPTQNLVYSIEIDHPLQKDSLEVILDYFISKGKEDYAGVNKIIVRTYLKGTASPGLPPYASMTLIGADKEIEINESASTVAESLNKINQEQETKVEQTEVQEKIDPLVGSYFCSRTHDTYVFNSDNTGLFIVQGCPPSNFTWKRSGNNVTVTHEAFGDEKLKFDPKKETLTEKSESFGTLIFNKQ